MNRQQGRTTHHLAMLIKNNIDSVFLVNSHKQAHYVRNLLRYLSETLGGELDLNGIFYTKSGSRIRVLVLEPRNNQERLMGIVARLDPDHHAVFDADTWHAIQSINARIP